MEMNIPKQETPAKHWSFVGVSPESVVLNYNHPDYDVDNICKHYEALSADTKATFDAFKVVDDSEVGVLFIDIDEYEHKTELLALIAALEA